MRRVVIFFLFLPRQKSKVRLDKWLSTDINNIRSVMLPLYLRTCEIFKLCNKGGCITASRCIACGCYYIFCYGFPTTFKFDVI